MLQFREVQINQRVDCLVGNKSTNVKYDVFPQSVIRRNKITLISLSDNIQRFSIKTFSKIGLSDRFFESMHRGKQTKTALKHLLHHSQYRFLKNCNIPGFSSDAIE